METEESSTFESGNEPEAEDQPGETGSPEESGGGGGGDAGGDEGGGESAAV
jgi:hypothetical protein